MAAGWLNIGNANWYSDCGDEGSGHTVANALVGSDYWAHYVTHTHFFVVDLGFPFLVSKVKGRSNGGYDPTEVNIYINDTGSAPWGAAVATGISTWANTTSFVEENITPKSGRYVKVEIIDTENVDNHLTFGATSPFKIFDVYGEIPPTDVSPDVLALELDLLTPTVIVSDIVVTSDVSALELDLLTPAIVYDIVVSPDVLALESDLLTPTVIIGDVEVLPDVSALELDLLTPTIVYDIVVSPGVLALESDLLTPTVIVSDIVVSPDVLPLELDLLTPTFVYDVVVSLDVSALELELLTPFIGGVFPTLSTSPEYEGWVDEYGDETVIRDSYASGYPLLNPQFMFDPKNFRHVLRLVSQTDKTALMTFYDSNKKSPFFWTNEQDAVIYFVIFTRKPRCQLDGTKDLWKLEVNLKQVTEL